MDELFNLVKACAEQAQATVKQLASTGIIEPLYLYYVPSRPGETGALMMVRDSEPAPSGAKLATGEGLRCDVPYSAYFQWIYDRSRCLPVLAY